MKKLIALMFAIVIVAGFTACANKEDITDELIDYHNNKWIPILVEGRKEFGDSRTELLDIQGELGEDYEEEAILLFKNEVIPQSEKIMESFKSIELEYKKVKKLNDLQVESEEIGHTLSKEVVDYLANHTGVTVKKNNRF